MSLRRPMPAYQPNALETNRKSSPIKTKKKVANIIVVSKSLKLEVGKVRVRKIAAVPKETVPKS